jgi:DNA-binding MarR family transcriptional regulator
MQEIEFIELIGSIQKKVMRRLSKFVAAEGLSMPEGVVLWRVNKLGPTRVSEIANQSGLPPSTLTGMLDRLVAGGWLERDDDPDDRRAVLMKSTPKLDEFTKNSMRSSAESLGESFRNLPPELMDRLVDDLASVLGCLNEDEGSQH